jgi:hypothetical protein
MHHIARAARQQDDRDDRHDHPDQDGKRRLQPLLPPHLTGKPITLVRYRTSANPQGRYSSVRP